MIDPRFALAGEWPDSPNLFFVHLESPRFVAEADDRVSHPRFFLTVLPGEERPADATFCRLVRQGAAFFYEQITEKRLKTTTPVEFIEGVHRRVAPAFLLGLTPRGDTLIIEPYRRLGVTAIDWATGTVKATAEAALNHPPRLLALKRYHREYLRRWRELRRQRRSTPGA